MLTSLVSSGFAPDVIVAHPGWGETLPLRTIFPRARIVLYCEFFYGTEGATSASIQSFRKSEPMAMWRFI